MICYKIRWIELYYNCLTLGWSSCPWQYLLFAKFSKILSGITIILENIVIEVKHTEPLIFQVAQKICYEIRWIELYYNCLTLGWSSCPWLHFIFAKYICRDIVRYNDSFGEYCYWSNAHNVMIFQLLWPIGKPMLDAHVVSNIIR